MTFYTLVDPTNEEIELPWLNEFLEQDESVSNGSLYEVVHVKSTPKGFIVTTESFNAWVWRKTPLGVHLSATLSQATQTDTHPTMCVCINLKTKTKFQLGFTDETHSKYTWSVENSTFTLHPQKNLPLDITPEDSSESKGAISSGKARKQSSAPHRA